MANEEHLKILQQGVAAWNEWREGNDVTPDLMGADFRAAPLAGANFSNTHFGGARLGNADLSGSNLVAADLFGVDLTITDLSHANLDCANLSSADFRSSYLSGSNLESAILAYTTFANCDLSEAKGLERVTHSGPSTIGLDTIYRSKGKIPESFLRGCGMPESFITQMHSLVGAEKGFEFYSCFLSHSTKDKEFADRLYGRLQQSKLRVWFAPEDMKGGEKAHEQIETAIRFYDKLLIVLSEHSLQSEWVMDELRKGFKAARQSGKRKLFPVLLTDYGALQSWVCRDSLSGQDLAEEVRQYFIPDFSHWKDHDCFESAFTRLLKDLRAEESGK